MGVRLSKKHGLNPMVVSCYVCGKDTGELALLGEIADDAEAPRHGALDRTPCPKCVEYTKQGIILISVKNGEKGPNPYRTGGWLVIKEEAFKMIFKTVPDGHIAFVDDDTWDKAGLPRGRVEGVPTA